MRGILKSAGIVVLAVYLTQQVIPTIKISTLTNFVILSGLIYLINFIVNPLTKILFFLPNNILVFNLIQSAAIFGVLFFLVKNLTGFQISNFNFPGTTDFGVTLGAYQLTTIQTIVVTSILISLITNFLNWLTD